MKPSTKYEPRVMPELISPPSDADRELALIGTALTEGATLVNAVGGIVQADDFTSPARIAAWSAIVEACGTSGMPDYLAVSDAIAATSDMDVKAARLMLADAERSLGWTAAPEAHAQRIAHLAARRRTIEKAGDIAAKAWQEDVTPAELADEILREFADLDRRSAAAEDTSFERCLDAILEPRASGHSMGVAKLDEWTGGLVPGRYYVVSGASGVGKTWLMVHMGVAAAQAGARVLYVSREMSKRDMFPRVGASVVGAKAFRLNRPQCDWSDDDHQMALGIAHNIAELKGSFEVSDQRSTPAEIGAAIRAGGFDVAFIDYAQILNVPGKDYEQLKELESWLIGLCKSGDVAVVIGSQLNNAHVFNSQSDDTSGHLGGSRLNNGASADIRLKRAKGSDGEDDPDLYTIGLRKHRHGPDERAGMSDTFRFERDTGRIRLAHDPYEIQPEEPSW